MPQQVAYKAQEQVRIIYWCEVIGKYRASSWGKIQTKMWNAARICMPSLCGGQAKFVCYSKFSLCAAEVSTGEKVI